MNAHGRTGPSHDPYARLELEAYARLEREQRAARLKVARQVKEGLTAGPGKDEQPD